MAPTLGRLAYGFGMAAQRIVHMIHIKLVGAGRRGFYIRPSERDTDAQGCRLADSQRTWYTARAGDAVTIRRSFNANEWDVRYIETITLYRVTPVAFNGTIVESVQTWMDETP